MIELDSVVRRYGDRTAVDHVSFSISKGECFGLLGPNGAGKTTTLSMLIGILRADSGTVRIDGRDPQQAETRRRIGIAPQALSLYDEMTAEENLAFLARLYDITGSRLKERVNAALEFAELTDRRNDRVTSFSGGMKRRLNMACAVIHEPEVILLDEPTVGVDPQSRNHIFERIESIRQNGCTIIYTTHYMEEAQRLCDRVGVMDHGTLPAVGTVEDLIRDYGGDSIVMTRPAAGTSPELLPVPPDSEGLISYPAEDPMQSILQLAQSGVQLETLRIRQPNLEDVFLNLTGRTLRDE